MQLINSVALVLAASLSVVQAIPSRAAQPGEAALVEARQKKTSALFPNGDPECPYQLPFRVSQDKGFWNNMCNVYGTTETTVCAIKGNEKERTWIDGKTIIPLCRVKYPDGY